MKKSRLAAVVLGAALLLMGEALYKGHAQPSSSPMPPFPMMGGMGGGGALALGADYLYVLSGGVVYKLSTDKLQVVEQAALFKAMEKGPGSPRRP